MNIKEKKEQVKNWVNKNKITILVCLAGAATVVISTMVVSKKVDNAKIEDELLLEPVEESVPEKTVLMNFTDELTGEILWKERCTEGYMNDFKDSGIEYEEVRKLNDIEEA